MRFLPTAVHGAIDYLWGFSLLASPYVFGFADGGRGQWVAMIFGAGAILYSFVTAYELGALRILPMEAHLILDGIGGAALAASPWVLGFADRVFWPHLLFGLFSVAASLVTHTRPANPVHAVSRP
jgi:hypothetical protein